MLLVHDIPGMSVVMDRPGLNAVCDSAATELLACVNRGRLERTAVMYGVTTTESANMSTAETAHVPATKATHVPATKTAVVTTTEAAHMAASHVTTACMASAPSMTVAGVKI